MILEINEVTRRYMTRTAVNRVSLTLRPGTVYALLGPNGSGKTTLMKLIAGLTLPTSGQILVDGVPADAAAKARIAYMPTENYFYHYMSIRDAGKYYADFYADFSYTAYLERLERMRLNEKDKIRSLSSGMSAKVRLALALSRDAELMMFDEPLNGVDMLTREQVIREIVAARGGKRTMLISTHLVDELEQYLDELVFMSEGELLLKGKRADLIRESTLPELYRQVYGEVSAC